jgi:predicted metal-dependent peptidase
MTTIQEQDAATLRLVAGRAKAVEKQPYLSTALYAMKPVKTTGLETFGVDKRWRMYWNPDFCLTMSVDECAGVWLHEVGHLLRGHRARFEASLEPQERHPLWNMAGDAAINEDLRSDGIELPLIKAFYPERIPGGEAGMITEQFYRLLLDTPALDKVSRQKQDLLLVPGQVRYDYGSQRIVGFTRRSILTGPSTFTVIDGMGMPLLSGNVNVHDRRTFDFDLNGTPLMPGEYLVTVACDDESASAVLRVTYPAIDLRPDHISKGYTAPFKVVVNGNDTRFDHETTVELLDSEGEPVVGAVTNITHISATYLTFDLGTVPDGVYKVVVAVGSEVTTKVLPVGMPYLDLNPPSLPSGHGTPYPMAGLGDDIVFGTDTTMEVLDPEQGFAPIPGAIANLNVVSDTVVNFALDVALPDGQYVVTATSAGLTAVTTLTVGGQGSGDGQGGGSGSGEGEGDGEGDDSGEGGGSGKGKGKGDGDDDSDLLPDCGSGAGGAKRDYELDDNAENNNDGSVDDGRGNLIREQVAREIREHVKSRGTVPGGWTRWADTILKPQVDWRKELRSVVRRTCATVAGMKDYTYSRPSRRTGAVANVVLPAMRAPRPPQVACVVDTSGSVSDKMLGQAIGDMGALLKQIASSGGDDIKLIACDAAAAEMKSVRDMKNLTALDGGGGTDMRVGMEAAAEINPKVDLVVVFTDGETPWPEVPPTANPRAKYVAVLLAGDTSGYYEVPDWMHKIVVDDAYLRNNR